MLLPKNYKHPGGSGELRRILSIFGRRALEAQKALRRALREIEAMSSNNTRLTAMRLYKDILRQHRFSLPRRHRELGDRYVRSEFKAHKEATGEQVDQFMHGWQSYLDQLRDQSRGVGRSLSEEEVANLSDEQREQLFRLKQQTSASGGTSVGDVTKP